MRRKLHLLMLLTTVALALGNGGSPAHASSKNTDPDRVSVYDFNVNQLKQSNWKGWFAWIKQSTSYEPDVILAEDLSGLDFPGTNQPCPNSSSQICTFQDQLVAAFGGTWHNFAVHNPASSAEYNARVVFYRTARFNGPSAATNPSKARAVWGYGDQTGGTGDHDGDHDNDGQCEIHGQTDAPNGGMIQARLYDKIASRWISVIVFKTNPGMVTDCSWENMKLAKASLTETGWTGSLEIVGTDNNEPDRIAPSVYTCWYRGTNGQLPAMGPGCDPGTGGNNLGFADPIYQQCSNQVLDTCLDDNWTHGDKRIDYLLGIRSDGARPASYSQQTLPRGTNNDGSECINKSATCDKPWSDHRSIRTTFSYTYTSS